MLFSPEVGSSRCQQLFRLLLVQKNSLIAFLIPVPNSSRLFSSDEGPPVDTSVSRGTGKAFRQTYLMSVLSPCKTGGVVEECPELSLWVDSRMHDSPDLEEQVCSRCYFSTAWECASAFELRFFPLQEQLSGSQPTRAVAWPAPALRVTGASETCS